MSEDNKDIFEGFLLGTISLIFPIGGDYMQQNMEDFDMEGFDIEGDIEEEASKKEV